MDQEYLRLIAEYELAWERFDQADQDHTEAAVLDVKSAQQKLSAYIRRMKRNGGDD